MPLLLRLVVVACLLINCVDCEFTGNNITASTVSDYETWTTALSGENYTKDYVTQNSEIIDEVSIKSTTLETSKCDNCLTDGSTVTTELISTANFEETSTPSYSSEIFDDDAKIEEGTSQQFDELTTQTYSSEIIDIITSSTARTTEYPPTTEGKPTTILHYRKPTTSTTTTSPDSAEINTVCSECNHRNPKIRNFKVSRTVDRKVLLSWDPMEESYSDCEYQYTINSSSSRTFIPLFRHQISNSYLYDNLWKCEKYDVVIEANNICGFKDTIYKTIYTDPEKVGDFAIQIFKGFTTIIWPSAVSSHCSRYRVRINGDTFETDNNVLVRNTTLYCANVGIQTIRSDNVTGEMTFATAKPGEVNNLQIDSSAEGQLKARWESPVEPSCVKSYRIKLEEPNTNTAATFEETSEHEYVFSDLQSCSTYTISVAAVSDDGTEGDFKEKSAITREPENIKIVEKIEHRYENRKVFLTWAPPELQEKCIAHYKLNIDGNEVKKNNPPYIHNAIGCKTYNTKISAVSKTGNQSTTSIDYTIPAIIPQPPSLEIKKGTIEKTKATFTVRPETNRENMCELVRVKVTCLAVNNGLPWVVQYKMVENDIEDGQAGKEVVVNVDGLSEFTTYSCTAQVENGAGWSSFSTPVEITTKEEVPTEPQLFTHENVDSTAFKLNWKPPYKIPGDLGGYRLTIEPIKSLHFETEECKEKPEKSPEIISLLAKETSYTYTKALPNYRYKCSIEALTIDFGKPATLQLDTLSGTPDPPSNLSVETDIKHSSTYIASAILQWLHPCKTRGIVKYFEATLTGENSEKSKSLQREFILPHEDLKYSYTFSNLLPLYEYEVKLKTVLINGNPSEEVSEEFKSPDGYPSPPTSIIAQSLTENSFSVCWKSPINQNGKLTFYTLNISALEPIHEVPDECSKDSSKYSTIVSAEETCNTFEEARPFYKYEIIVTASTETTTGFSSAPLLHGTPRSVSEPVRNLTSVVSHEQTEEYNSSVFITFTKPCNINGLLAYYEISLFGKSKNEEEEHVARTLEYEWSFVLKPAFKYEVGIAVITECSPYCKSPVANEHFTAPAGVPPLIPNSSKPALDNIEENTVTIVFNKDMFGEDVGEIMYYAILLTGAEVYNSSKENYGFWDDWPDLGFWRNDTTYVETYQATPIKWNPFTQRNADSAEFILGAENCTDFDTYCNGPLRPDTKYYMEIRAFTANAYRSNDALTFTTRQIEDLETASSVVKIIGIVVGVLSFVILCGIAVFFWRRKRAKTVENNDVDNQDVQYRPIRLKQFPRYYNEIKETEQILKTEFMFLNSLSADWELPMSEALLSENRKKNRYINVLPYDDIRVVLDDDMSSYINASYIKGYSNKVEYIATQGPLKSTNLDFWKMILQENVTVIVMVAHFIEQEKEKCYRYIPEDSDPVDIGDDIKIRCAAKLDFKSHCERHVKIQTSNQRHEVTHLQFLNWPDFGCPTGTENMLNFCRIMRSHVKEDPGTIVVHCSAGVGRTGTLIAVDILLQTMSDGLDIDVFHTVLNLRKQRKNMVQTQPQYEYIYTCLYDAMMDPPPFEEIKAYEPVYENVKNAMEMKVFKSDNNENIETNL